MDSTKTLKIVIDPSGAQTGGRVVSRVIDDIAKSAMTTKDRIEDLTMAQAQAAKSAQGSFQAMAQAQDALRAKFNPTFAVLQRYKQTQDEIRSAHRLGAISAGEMTTAIGRERQATLSAIQAIKGHTAAVITDNGAMRNAAFQRRNLIFQLNDVAVSLASGMNPLMVMAQQGSQIGQIYMGQGGVTTALKETGNMAANAAVKFGRIGAAATIAGSVAMVAFAHIRREASAAIGETVTYGEVLKATFQTIWDGLSTTFGPAVNKILDPLMYAFDKLSSAAVDVAELVINSFRAAGADIAFVWSQLPNIVGGTFVGAVNVAIDHLNLLVKASKDSVNQIIDAFNLIPGVDLSRLDTSGQAIPRVENTYVGDLAKTAAEHAARQQAIMSSHPLREGAQNVIDRIGTNQAQSRLADLANMDFSTSIKGATALGQAVGGIATAAQQASSTVIDVNQQMMDGRRQTLIAFEQSGKQLRNMKTELKDIQATLAQAAKTPVSDVFGDLMSEQAAGSIAAASSSIQKVFAALNEGRMTAQTAHESLELIRASLHQLGGDRSKVDAFVDSLVNANIHVGNLESGVKSLSASIMGIPNRTISIGIQQYTVPSSSGGKTGVNVYGGAADFSYQQYTVGGGKTVGVSAGNGSYGTTKGYYYDQPGDLQAIDDMYGTNYAGARAAGGPVAGGKQYLVGENGPELVTMGGAGTVTNANSTASILSGGRDTLSLIEDHLYSIMQELRIHTNYWETAESNAAEMITCLQAIKSVQSSSSSYGGSSGGSSSSSRGSFAGSSSRNGGNQVDYNSVYADVGLGFYSGHVQPAFMPYSIAPGKTGVDNVINPYLHKNGFATGGQILPGEDQRVEFFKKNSERVIIVDDAKVSDGRGAGRQQTPRAERPIQIINNFHGDIGDPRSRQAMEDQFRRAVQQVARS